MKTTVIKVQETRVEIEISFLGIKLDNYKTYEGKDKNGNTFSFKTIVSKRKPETHIIFEKEGLRFTQPVQFLEETKLTPKVIK